MPLLLLKQAVREAATICLAPVTLTFGLLILKVVSESLVTWATSVPILVFLGLSVFDLGPMYATDRQTSDSIIAIMLSVRVQRQTAGGSASSSLPGAEVTFDTFQHCIIDDVKRVITSAASSCA